MKRNVVLLCFVCFLFALTITIPVFASEPKQGSESTLLEEGFKQLVPPVFSAQEMEKLKAQKYPVDNLKNMVLPQDWFITRGNLTNDLKMVPVNDGWRISTSKTVRVYSSQIRGIDADFSLDITLRAGEVPSTVAIGAFQYDILHQYELIPLQTVSLSAGEKKTIHLPVYFGSVNSWFRVEFKISGDIIFSHYSVRYSHPKLAEKGLTCVEGTLEACSAIPDPQKSDYPDCRFTCHFQGDNIQSGTPCPRELQLIIDGFKEYKLCGTKVLKSGDKIRCIILPFDKLSEKMKSTQQADDLSLFQLENYYAVKIEKINAFSHAGLIPFTDTEARYVSVFERKINQPLTKEVDAAQQTAIANALEKINSMLDGWDKTKIQATNAEFKKAYEAEKDKDQPGYNRIKVGKNTFVWRNVDNSFWTLPEQYTLISLRYQPILPGNMEALVAFRDFLHANGCQFIISIVPDLFCISSRIINPKFRDVPDFSAAMLVQDLLNHGIEAIYASDALIQNYNRYPWAFFYPDNLHPSDTCQDVLNDLIVERLQRFHLTQTLERDLFSVILKKHVYEENEKYLFPEHCDIGNNKAKTSYQCRCVLYDNKEIKSDSASPILVIGNSFIQTPMTFPDSLPTLLSFKLRRNIDSFRIGGWGPMTNSFGYIFSKPEKYLANKKIVIMQVGAPHLRATNKFINVRKLDAAMELLSGKKIQSFIPVYSNIAEGENNNDSVKRLQQLPEAKLFQIPTDGAGILAEFEIPNCVIAKETVLVIPTGTMPSCAVKIAVNGFTNDVEEHEWHFAKNIFRIPPGTTHAKVELKGKPGTIIAVNNIQIYQ